MSGIEPEGRKKKRLSSLRMSEKQGRREGKKGMKKGLWGAEGLWGDSKGPTHSSI